MTQKILITLTLLAALGLLGLALWSGDRTSTDPLKKNEVPVAAVPTLRMEDGVQVIRVLARGGYEPAVLEAESGVPTRLEVETRGTYDCSSAFTIPAMEYKKMLPPTGVTVIDLATPQAGTTLSALCSMGMYTLDIRFR